MIDNTNIEVANGVFVRDLTDNKFKTMRISVNFIVPLSVETVSGYALIPSLITQVTKKQPTIIELSKYLANLYGATLGSSVATLGDNQVLSVSISGIADKFALDGEKLSEIFANLVCQTIYEPLVDESGDFLEENFKQEKRQIVESLESDINDKMVYVKTRLREIMFENEPAAVGRVGNFETVEAVVREELKNQLEYIIKNARIEILVMGNCDYNAIKNVFKDKFSQDRTPVALKEFNKVDVLEVKDVTEELNLSQSKLVMGFRANLKQEQINAAKLMCMILGGSASSKFFLNIREKLSLCYYCSSAFDAKKSVMVVHSGIETVNIEVAREAILKELEDMKNSVFTDEDIEFAKLSMCNSYNSVDDSLSYKEVWYMSQILENEFVSPQEMVEIINKISREEIVEAAKSMVLDTVFTLKGVGSVE